MLIGNMTAQGHYS